MTYKTEPLEFYLRINRRERLDLVSQMQRVNDIIENDRHRICDNDFIDAVSKCKQDITQTYSLNSNEYNSLYNVVKHLPCYTPQLVDRYIRRHLTK